MLTDLLKRGIERRRLERTAGSYRTSADTLINYRTKYGDDEFLQGYIKAYSRNWSPEVLEELKEK